MKIPITDRLLTVAGMVEKCDVLCDIGCDHGYLPIKLLSENKINFAYACDVNEAPLKSAERNFEKFFLLDKADFKTGDGLKAVNGIKIDAVTICGMGGRLIARILEDGKKELENASQIILQPMTEVFVLRKYLYENNFCINIEKLSKEGKRFYNILEVEKGKNGSISLLDMYTGAGFIDEKCEFLFEYLEKQHSKFTKLYYCKRGHEDTKETEKVLFELENFITKKSKKDKK